jgi:LysM repeat protein
MNTNSPFVPQGTTPPRGKSSLHFKVLLILTIHVVVIGGMLLQGCKDIPKEQATDSNSTNSPDMASGAATNTNSAIMPPVSIATLSNNQAALGQPAGQQLAPSQPAPLIQQPLTVTTAAPAPSSAEYVIAAGDTLGAIAKRQHISLQALMDANPGIDARELHIGQRVVIPGATSGAASGGDIAAADSSVYVVKAGDTLGKIARLHGTSYKKLMALNDLKTTAIRVGQKLKVPAPKPAGAEAIPASAATAQPQPAAIPAPVSTAAAPAPASTGVAS